MDIQYGQLANLHWFWLVLLIAIVTLTAIGFHQRAVMQFATPNLLGRLVRGNQFSKSVVSTVLTLTALVLLVVALVDIRWGRVWREVPQRGIEVIFALDVSRSMLAEDVAPNRLQRAKQYIKDIVSEMQGDRVGLILFAGDVKRQVPLTKHYDDFKQSLEEVGPHNLTRGGSNLGSAIRVATESFLEKVADHKAIVLFTDGEDHESKPIEAAQDAFDDEGVRVFTVGLGDFETGARIPVQAGSRRASFVKHRGEQVWSKLDGEILKKIAKTSDGAYIPAGTKQVDMAEVYHRFIRSVDEQEFDVAKINAYVPRYPWFLAAAILLLLTELLISTWPRERATTEVRAFESYQ